MEINFYQAECGDAASIRFLGNDNKYHNIFIDAGYERTFRHALEKEIKEIIKRNEQIDIWIISHIHDDHIGGVLKYIDCITFGEFDDIVSKYLYNPPRVNDFTKSFNNPSKTVSIDQGDLLYEYLKSTNKIQNFDILDTIEPIEIAGLKLIFLSPSQKKINRLRKKYSLDKLKPLERQEDEIVSEAVSQKENDYKTPIKDFDLNNFKEDKSIENGSSISFISEFKNKKNLWLADSHPSDIAKSLKKLGYSKNNKLTCEWVKVTHHGSKGNNSDELYSLIDCSNYLLSANGDNKHNLPSKECIARILRNKKRSSNSKYKFHFTYNNDTLRSIFDTDEENTFKDYNFEVFFENKNKLSFLLDS